MDELNLTTLPCFSQRISDPAGLYQPVSFICPAGAYPEEQYLQNHSEITAAQIDNLRNALSDTQHAGTGYLKSVFLRCRHVSDLHRSARPLSIYLRTGSPAAHRFLGNIHLGNPYFRQGT